METAQIANVKMDNVAVIIYPRVGNNASRILKQANFLTDKNIAKRVLILSMFHDDRLQQLENISDFITIKRIKTKTYHLPKNALGDTIKFIEFFFKCIRIIRSVKPVFVIPHSLSVLPIGVFSKTLRKRKVIYDAHELETERNNLHGVRKQLSQFVERRLIKYCDKVIVVNTAIEDWYKKTYKIKNVFSIPNFPVNPYLGRLAPKTSTLRDEFKIPEESIVFIYQGILSKARGIEELLSIFKKTGLPKDRVIIFMGMGDMEDEVKKASEEYEQIFFKPAVLPGEIIENTSSADVGIFIIPDNSSLSYQLSLPNKFMEYSIAGLYICVNDKLKVMKELIHKNYLGTVVGSTKEEIENFIRSVTKEEIKKKYLLSTEYRKKIDWSLNYHTLLEVFNN